MQSRFEIQDTQPFETDDTILSVQVGAQYLAYAIFDKDGTQLLELKWFSTASPGVSLTNVFETEPLLGRYYFKKIIAFDFPTYTLLPSGLNEGDNTALLHLTGTDPQDHILNEMLPGNISLIYSVPFSILNQCIHNIPGASYWHLQTALIKNALLEQHSSALYVNIVDSVFSVVAKKNAALILAQTYSYRSPADLLFYLLKIAQAYDLSQKEVLLKISGLIDKDSALFKTLYDYFLHIELAEPQFRTTDTTVPLHYFNTLNQVVLCEL